VRIVIAEDGPLPRAATARLLADAGLDVVGRAEHGADLLRKARAHRPDVALIGTRRRPADDDVAALRALRAELPAVAVLVFSDRVDERYLAALLDAGAAGAGYLLEGRIRDVDHLVDTLGRLAGGDAVLDPEVLTRVHGGQRRVGGAGALEALDARDRDVLAHMAAGRTNRGIARLLFLSERAIERQITAIFAKLDLPASQHSHRRILAVLAYLADGRAQDGDFADQRLVGGTHG
jgi:DNA-binding NarL/FixJ family response regulator